MPRWWSPSANTNEVLYLVTRPGNVVSYEGCVPWIDRAIKLVAPYAEADHLARGRRLYLDRRIGSVGWARSQIRSRNRCPSQGGKLGEALPEQAWKPLERLPRYEIVSSCATQARANRGSIVRFKGYERQGAHR